MSKKAALLAHHFYTPNHLLDVLMQRLDVSSDAALARALRMPPSTISKVRNKRVPISSSLLLSAHELSGISIRELRTLLGDIHTKYWQGDLSIESKAPSRFAATSVLSNEVHHAAQLHQIAAASIAKNQCPDFPS